MVVLGVEWKSSFHCVRGSIYFTYYISNEVKKLSLSGKRRAMVEKPVLFAAAAAQPSVHSHSAQSQLTVELKPTRQLLSVRLPLE